MERWKKYFEELMKEKHVWRRQKREIKKCKRITREEVRKAIK